jgi:hypothetical protein
MAEDKTVGKVVMTVIAIIVLIVLLVLIVRPNTLSYFRNMPGYQVDNTDKVVDNLQPGQSGNIICQGKPGRIIATINNKYISGTNLYISKSTWGWDLPGGDPKDFKYIRYDRSWETDPVVAFIGNNRISIRSNIDVWVYASIKSQLDLLNGAYFYTTNQICVQNVGESQG